MREVHRRGVHVLRIHVAGDLYSIPYAEKWITIMDRCPRTTFYLYTRSWRCPEFIPVLTRMAEVDNCHLWFSIDGDTGVPTDTPPRVRLAYMVSDAAEDPGDVELVFKVPELRHTRSTRYSLALVCSTEVPNASEDRTCTSCRRCFT